MGPPEPNSPARPDSLPGDGPSRSPSSPGPGRDEVEAEPAFRADTILSPPTADAPPTAPEPYERALGDFSITPDVWVTLVLSLVVGAVSAGVALGLLDLIGVFTHLFYYGTLSAGLVQPSVKHLGWLSIFIPIGGGIVVGAVAYWGSERIRGHGIPEAMETILVGGSKVEPRLAVLKPLSSAVSIGTGGPFGAEGPIILTGGAFGSVIAQFFHLSASQRRTLLVAGACGGMAAVFGTPVAATLFGIELLVFEWKPRSMVPIAAAVAVAETIRGVFSSRHLLPAPPLFPVPPHGPFSPLDILAAAGVGVAGGLLAWVLTVAVYGAEDAFKKLPIHWAWWPAIGGLVIGAGGLIDPRALGVGYASINAELGGRIALGGLATLLVVKLVIWSVGLGSGTSGGILAPLLIMGAAMGGLMSPVLPGGSSATWALLGMAATLAGVTRSPFTAIVFAFELTHDTGSLLPLLTACALAHLISSLVLKRSILTEKVARRGFHVVREYQVEPLEAVFVREAMIIDVVVIARDEPLRELRERLARNPALRRQRLYPVVGPDHSMVGVVLLSDVARKLADDAGGSEAGEVARTQVVVAHPDETLRAVADRMAEHCVGALPVVERGRSYRVVGIITEFDLLKARQRQLVEERDRERVLRFGRASSRPVARQAGIMEP
jgi:CIC family chloride channel protein